MKTISLGSLIAERNLTMLRAPTIPSDKIIFEVIDRIIGPITFIILSIIGFIFSIISFIWSIIGFIYLL